MSETTIAQLEERIAWLEKHVVEQDKVILAMRDDYDRTKAHLELLRERMQSREVPLDPNEKPPHY